MSGGISGKGRSVVVRVNITLLVERCRSDEYVAYDVVASGPASQDISGEVEGLLSEALARRQRRDDDDDAGDRGGVTPVCYRCEEDCDACEHTLECYVSGNCSECSVAEECWGGKSAPTDDDKARDTPHRTTPPPPCYNCRTSCRWCDKFADPAACMHCGGCGLRSSCSVYRGRSSP